MAKFHELCLFDVMLILPVSLIVSLGKTHPVPRGWNTACQHSLLLRVLGNTMMVISMPANELMIPI